MDKDMASRMLKAGACFGSQDWRARWTDRPASDEKERNEYARALGNVIGIVSEDFVRRIARQYPELDPDR